MTIDLDAFRWLYGAPPPSLRFVRDVKGDGDAGRRVLLMTDGDQSVAVKRHRVRRWSNRLRAARGRSPLGNESIMLDAANQAGLPVPVPRAYGVRRVMGVVTAEALLETFFPDRQALRWWVTEAVDAGRHHQIDVAIDLSVSLLAAARRAGLADADFTLNHLLVPQDGDAADLKWIDLEAARRADPDDPQGTGESAGRLLGNLFVATRGRDDAVRSAMRRVRDRLPTPRGGWDQATQAIARVMAQSVERARRRGRIDKPAPGL